MRNTTSVAIVALISITALAVVGLLMESASAGSHAEPACAVEYTIRPGDTLGRIASQHGVDVDRIAAANGIIDPNLIHAGDTLCMDDTTTLPVHRSITAEAAIEAAFKVWGKQAVKEALEVAKCESSLDPAAHRTSLAVPTIASGDRGLFQINHIHDDQLVAQGLIGGPADLFDPAINAAVAAEMYASQGWGPWFMSGDCHGLV